MFNTINNKKNRKMLAKDVLEYRKEYHLVTPYLCRIVAIVNLHYKDIGETVNDIVFGEYEKVKDTVSTTFVANDKKSRIMKYICEFTKFKVIEADKTLNCIETLIDNLNGFNISLIISVLENVGRFLHLSENSGNRFTFLMKKY
jgi:regulator of nonsense transcripts 2